MSFAAPVGMFIAGPVSELLGVSNWMILTGVLMVFVSLLRYLLTREFDIRLIKVSAACGENIE
jgi:DHA3 family macrolide efflux protein-like MFS transporter